MRSLMIFHKLIEPSRMHTSINLNGLWKIFVDLVTIICAKETLLRPVYKSKGIVSRSKNNCEKKEKNFQDYQPN